jgi:hypothetical protein
MEHGQRTESITMMLYIHEDDGMERVTMAVTNSGKINGRGHLQLMAVLVQ